VLARVDGIAVTTYTLERTFSSMEESYYPQWWTPCGTYHHEGQEQITLTVHHDRFTEENLFSSRILGPLYPSMITEFSSLDPFNGLPTRIQTRLDVLGRYVVEPYVVNDDGSGGTVLCTSIEDSMLFFPDQNIRHQFSFTEQIGLTYSDFYYFEGGATRNLEGYRLDGEEWGTVWSNSMILGSLETYTEQARLVPNPADDHLGMLNVSPGTTFSIIDVQGRLLRQHQITEANEHIDVRALPPGVYLLRMEGSRPQRFVISR